MGTRIFLVQGPEEPFPRQITQGEWEELFQVRYLAQQRFQDAKACKRAVRYCPLFFKGSLGLEQRWLAKWYAQEPRTPDVSLGRSEIRPASAATRRGPPGVRVR